MAKAKRPGNEIAQRRKAKHGRGMKHAVTMSWRAGQEVVEVPGHSQKLPPPPRWQHGVLLIGGDGDVVGNKIDKFYFIWARSLSQPQSGRMIVEKRAPNGNSRTADGADDETSGAEQQRQLGIAR